MYGYTHNKDACINRLRRIEGQVRGLQRMVEDDKYCIDIRTHVCLREPMRTLVPDSGQGVVDRV